jgi:membrane-associated protein
VVAGMASMNYLRFVLVTGIGAVVWGVGLVLLGYFLGSLVPDAGKYIEYIVVLIFLASVIPPVIHLLRERAKERAEHAEQVEREKSKTTLTSA